MNLVVDSVSKRYGNVTALDGVSVSFEPGEIHGVLGQNGAGKSTLMGVLAGFVVPGSGSVRFRDMPLPVGRPQAVRKLGIEMVHQHFTLVPTFTIEENLALANLDQLAARLDVDAASRPSFELARTLGWELPRKTPVSELPVGLRQRVEILKALVTDAPVLILDEPTATLSNDEIEDLFRVLRDLRSQGKTVILIAHKLSEVVSICDRVTVLREGRNVLEIAVKDTDIPSLANAMIGEMPQPAPAASVASRSDGLTVSGLQVHGDRGDLAVRGATFDAPRGSILGIGGVDGNGQVELAEALVGIRNRIGGDVSWENQPTEPRDLASGYIPQDRQTDGLALRMSIQDNLLLGAYDRSELGWGPFLSPKKVRIWAEQLIRTFGIKVGDRRDPVGTLSGGNQQKVVVSRAIDADPSLLIAVNPTRGLDFQSTETVHRHLLDARARGKSVIVFSTDLDELAALSDERRYMSRGELHAGDSAMAVLGEQS